MGSLALLIKSSILLPSAKMILILSYYPSIKPNYKLNILNSKPILYLTPIPISLSLPSYYIRYPKIPIRLIELHLLSSGLIIRFLSQPFHLILD